MVKGGKPYVGGLSWDVVLGNKVCLISVGYWLYLAAVSIEKALIIPLADQHQAADRNS